MDQNTDQKRRAEKLTELLMANEHMMAPLEALMEQVHSEKALGRKADDVEQIIIKHLRVLGHESLQQWARKASEAAKPENKAQRHAKKNSGS